MMIPIRMIDIAYQEPNVRLELTTARLQGECSTTELIRQERGRPAIRTFCTPSHIISYEDVFCPLRILRFF